jgi:hypothetical protein
MSDGFHCSICGMDWSLCKCEDETEQEKCKDHPRYKVKHKPACLCEKCWELWLKKQKKV